jgi:glycine cleavage system H protein
VNDDLLSNPSLANQDPYAAWMVQLKPEDWDSVKASLVPGSEVAGPYEAKMAADGFEGCA